MAWRRGRALDGLDTNATQASAAEPMKVGASLVDDKNNTLPEGLRNRTVEIESLLSNDTLVDKEDKADTEEESEETLRKPNDNHIWHEDPVNWNKNNVWFLKALKEQVFH